MSYSIPKGVQRGLEVDLSDKMYDGHQEGDRLVGGLGQLVDGQKGTDNFRTDIHGFGKGIVYIYITYGVLLNLSISLRAHMCCAYVFLRFVYNALWWHM